MWGSLYWIIAEDYEGAHKEFEYALQCFSALGAVSKSDVSMPLRNAWKMRLATGQVIETKSGQDVYKLRSDAPDGILLVEAATVSNLLFLKCFGRLSETHGWIVASGTFEGSTGWYPELWRAGQSFNEEYRCRSFSIPSWTNTIVFPDGRNDQEIQRLYRVYSKVPGMFEERVAGVPLPSRALVFREFTPVQHTSETATYKPNVPVYIAVDPSDGGHPYALLACQFALDQYADPDDPLDICNVIDEIYEQGVIDEEVIAMATTRPWWRDVRGGAIDVAAPDSKRRWLSMGGVNLKSDKIDQLAGIRRLHSFLFYQLANPDLPNSMTLGAHLQINPTCESLIAEFGKYRRRDTDPLSDELPAELPNPNQPCDALKALWYLLVARFGAVRARRLPAPKRTQWRRQDYHASASTNYAKRQGAVNAANRRGSRLLIHQIGKSIFPKK